MNPHPSLLAAIGDMDPGPFTVGVPMEGPSARRGSLFLIGSEQQFACWEVASLKSLFRGNRTPPPMNEYPAEYVPVFFQIERHLLVVAQTGRLPTDAEVEEAFANLRRRPDGRSLGPLHDALWQACALALGKFALSEAEFTAVAGRLSRSAGGRKQGPTSREYIGYLLQTFR